MSFADLSNPKFIDEDAAKFAKEHFGIKADASLLVSERDQNFLLRDEKGSKFVLKIANETEKYDILDMQNRAMNHIAENSDKITCPKVIIAKDGEEIVIVQSDSGNKYFMRLLSYLPGRFLAEIEDQSPELLYSLGKFMGNIVSTLSNFYHGSADRHFTWDLRHTGDTAHMSEYIASSHHRRIVEYFFHRFEISIEPTLKQLRISVIHNDANDHNVIVSDIGGKSAVTGLIDFGDMVYSNIVNELAVAAAYVMFATSNPLESAGFVVKGFHDTFPLEETEVDLLYNLIAARLCISVSLSAYRNRNKSNNEYLTISEKPALETLEKLIKINPAKAVKHFRNECGMPVIYPSAGIDKSELISKRNNLIGKSLSVSYKNHLKIIQGAFQYLFDEEGNSYLDTVNNVCHVGHCNPYVAKAAAKQISLLNTNTRYLHDNIIEYAERLTSLFPDKLDVCYFVCSGSEANELALRLAKTYTQREDFIVMEGAYHGNTSALVDISPYKFDGPGGKGAKPFIHKTLMPDTYRGKYRLDETNPGEKYAAEVKRILDEMESKNIKVGGYIVESLLGVGGNMLLPYNYLKEVYKHVRNAGGVCIADEVQVGFGRVGEKYWGFELQDVVPDIVTLGKPIGNGHPLGAVVTTAEIADTFNNGMEYFNTFGGNPVSCAVGLAVLDVIERDKLQENALNVGNYFMEQLKMLGNKYEMIGDVRGSGLFIGAELVRNRETLEPATEEVAVIIEFMKDNGVLASTDGPFNNVLKIKPSIIFTRENVDQYVNTLDKAINNLKN
ncbi:aminotransferase class III-fold pyridoxal phosphate-dependent enzyme [Bacteroidota bacterium]